MPAGRRKRTGGLSDHAPSVGPDLDRTPGSIGEIEIDAAVVLGDADMDRPLGTIELRPRLEQIERRRERCCARGVPGRLVVAAPQPGAKALCCAPARSPGARR